MFLFLFIFLDDKMSHEDCPVNEAVEVDNEKLSGEDGKAQEAKGQEEDVEMDGNEEPKTSSKKNATVPLHLLSQRKLRKLQMKQKQKKSKKNNKVFKW